MVESSEPFLAPLAGSTVTTRRKGCAESIRPTMSTVSPETEVIPLCALERLSNRSIATWVVSAAAHEERSATRQSGRNRQNLWDRHTERVIELLSNWFNL